MRNRVHSHEAPWRVLGLTAAALSAALLLAPLALSAQEQDQQEPGAQSGDQRLSRGAERFVRLYDLNGDGKISIEEINTDQARMFTALDIDDNERMSIDEIRRRGRSLQIFRTTTLFDLLDSDGDGELSLAEIQAPSKRWFKRYDQNGDGIMDANEVPAQRHWGHGRRR